ncbi:fluoride efflux transporter CrcB [Bifidobacterium mongoliense]|uniref:Fluoride-specific ion channel FluC n=1 Tax=Bifidobacterium mongoliense DSM 21395 TaxID=1437603 RepID=A0A087BZC4_9BIFI|nr:fluoride efflux transporter CrcB [Bifidobacterium mongoliense]KFI76374.1 CrcB-like protein [Bifidobacterium mongoliense DSM 21395]
MIVIAALCGGLGAVCRFLVDAWVNRRNRLSFPLGTLVVNLTACLLMGMVAGWVASNIGSEQFRLIVGTGFLGGYSTFSTASVEGVRLIRAGKPLEALVHTGGMLVLSVLATLMGFMLFT